MRSRSGLAGLMTAAVLLAGCGGQAGQEQPSPPAGGADPTTQEQVMAPDEVMQPLRTDAAERAGVDEAQVQVVRSERVTWPNGALGCPQPGTVYTQALVEGYHVVLEADGSSYDYRMPEQGEFVLCEQPPS